VYDLFNFGTKNENDQGGPWSPDWGQQPHPPTPQTLRHLLAATASRALFDNGQQQAEQLLAQPLQQQQQQQQFFYSPTPPGQFAGWPSFNVFSFFLSSSFVLFLFSSHLSVQRLKKHYTHVKNRHFTRGQQFLHPYRLYNK